jgi:L-alanine-DL-glutamate epimerase-like enolase superfamily enzyme
MSEISRIEITHHQLPLEPAFPASWDTKPRTKFPATIVRVFDDLGNVGTGSGDAMYGFADYQHYFLGHDPLDLERHGAVLSNIEFHAGRPWPMDIALWDLAGKIGNLSAENRIAFAPTPVRACIAAFPKWSRSRSMCSSVAFRP